MTKETKAPPTTDEPEAKAPPAEEKVHSPGASLTETEKWQAGVAASADQKAKAEAEAKAEKAAAKVAKKKRKPTWRETRWGTHAQYQCKLCHYTTFDLEAMAKHADAVHQEEEA
jgi:hypothetical protein